MKIIIGIARGLKYLHNEIDPPFTISELNSNAIYLTEDFSPKVRMQPCLNFPTYIIVILISINVYVLYVVVVDLLLSL
jgi:hypothetical protein